MEIGVKYCGGCNPRYERTELLEKLKKEYPQATIEVAKENKVYDFILVLCGCTSKCAAHEYLSSKYGKVFTASMEDYKLVEEKIHEIGNKYA